MRRPSDVFKAVLGLFLVIWATVNVESISSWAQALTELAQASPSWVILLLEVGYATSLIYVVVVFAALVAGGPERRPALRDLAIAGATAAVLVVILSFIINDAWPYVFPEIGLEDPAPRFPVLRVGMVTAILVVIGPHVTRPLRRFGWLAIVATAIASVSLGYGTPTHIIGSFGIGLFSAGLLLAIVGSPRGYPDPNSVAAAVSKSRCPCGCARTGALPDVGSHSFRRPGRRQRGRRHQGARTRRRRVTARGKALAHALVSRIQHDPRLLTTPGSRARGIDHHRRGSRRGAGATTGGRGEPHVGGLPHLVSRHRHRLARYGPERSHRRASHRDVGAGGSHAEGVIEQRLSGYLGSPGRPGWADHHRFRPRFPLCG